MKAPDLSKCPGCDLRIPTACARCQRPFHNPRLNAELHEQIVTLRAEVAALKLAQANPSLPPQLFPAVLPTMREWKELLLAEAVRRAGNLSAAAQLLGLGKATVYRLVTADVFAGLHRGRRAVRSAEVKPDAAERAGYAQK